MRRVCNALAGIALLAASAMAVSQEYPQKTIELIVPFSAGGSSDVIARELSIKLGEALGQTVVVINREGAGTQIGTNYVARSKPDGYTLLVADVPFTINPVLRSSVNYDPIKDFTPIGMIGTSSMYLYSSGTGYKSTAEAIQAAKDNPDTVSVATAGYGTTTHLMAEMLQSGSGAEFIQVQYKGSAPAMADTAAGHTDLAFSTLTSALPFVKAGTLNPIGIAAKERHPEWPDVRTFTEDGIPAMLSEHWWGILGPRGIDEEIVNLLSKEIKEIVSEPVMQKKLRELFVEPTPMLAQEFGKYLVNDVTSWKQVVEENDIQVE